MVFVCVEVYMMGHLLLQIIDAQLTEYELNNHQSQFYFTGKIYFKYGKQKHVRFFKFKKSEERLAKKIFFQTSKIINGRVLRAYFATYYEPQELWILCYDWFDYLLDEMQDDNDLKKEASSEDSDILSIWWANEIRYNIILISFIFIFISQLCIAFQIKPNILFLIH